MADWKPTDLFLIVTFTLMMTLVQGQQNPLTFSVREESDPDTYVGNIARKSSIYQMYNASTFQALSYQIPGSVTAFRIDAKSSTLRTARRLDREAICPDQDTQDCLISFQVSVYLSGPEGVTLLRLLAVTVTLQDVNDHAPAFPAPTATITVPESAEVGTLLALTPARDLDLGPGNTVQLYRLVGGADVLALTSSGPRDLHVRLNQRLDRELTSSYTVTVVAEDGGAPRLTGSVAVTVLVGDVNDNSPVFSGDAFAAAVPEDAPLGETVLTLSAEDKDVDDNGRLTFSLGPVTSTKVKNHFLVNETTGEVTLIKSLDFEKDTEFRFEVVARDHGSPPRRATASATVSVRDVNDNAPQLVPTWPLQEMSEAAKIDAYVGNIYVSDADAGDSLDCQVSNPRFKLKPFEGSPNTYTVLLAKGLDFEARESELINVSCSDGGSPPLSNWTALTLGVTDANDNAPVFTRTAYQAGLLENRHVGAFVVQVTAKDPDSGDNGLVSYRLARDANGRFAINAQSGVIKAAAMLDREEAGGGGRAHGLVVVATDAGSPPISATVSVTVAVQDENDNPPEFVVPHFEMRVSENLAKHAVVGTLYADDKDTDVDNHLRYALADASDADGGSSSNVTSLFGVDRMSGVVYTLAPLDREAKGSYSLRVVVVDESNPDFRDDATVSIAVADVNDNAPVIAFPNAVNNTFTVPVTAAAGSVVLAVEAADRDAQENASLRYSVMAGNHRGLFFLNARSGELVLAKRLSGQDVGSHALTLTVRDGGAAFLEARQEVTVMIVMALPTQVTLANGTLGAMEGGAALDHVAVVAALVAVTAVLALAVLITICIIRRIDRERKHHHTAKLEELNIYKGSQHHVTDACAVAGGQGHGQNLHDDADAMYKQQMTSTAASPPPPLSPSQSSADAEEGFANEINRLKEKIKRDLSYSEEENSGGLGDSLATSFSTFKADATTPSPRVTSPRGHQLGRLSNMQPPPRSQPVQGQGHVGQGQGLRGQQQQQQPLGGGVYHSQRGRHNHHWGPGRQGVEDSSSHHSSGSASDSGRGGSEEGDSHPHSSQRSNNAQVVNSHSHSTSHPLHLATAENERSRTPTSARQLVTFSPPRDPRGDPMTTPDPKDLNTSRSPLPRSMSETSDTRRKLPWSPPQRVPRLHDDDEDDDVLPPPPPPPPHVTSSAPAPAPAETSSSSPMYRPHNNMNDTSGLYRPNISFSDDSVTANTTVAPLPEPPGLKLSNLAHAANHHNQASRNNANNMSSNAKRYNNSNNVNNRVGVSSPAQRKLHANMSNSLAASKESLSGKPPLTSTRRTQNTNTAPLVHQVPNALPSPDVSHIPPPAPDDSNHSRHGLFLDTEGPLTAGGRSYIGSRLGRGVGGPRATPTKHNHVWRPNLSYDVTRDVTQSTEGEAYSLADVGDVLGASTANVTTDATINTKANDTTAAPGKYAQTSRYGPEPNSDGHRDDDNTTTTSGSYTINAEELCLEIDQLFFKDVVV